MFGADDRSGDRQNRRLRTLEALVESREVPLSGSVAIRGPPLDLCTSLAVSRVAVHGELLQPSCQLSPSLASGKARTTFIGAGCPPSETTSQSQSHALLSTIPGFSSSDTFSLVSASAPPSSASHDILHRLLQEDDCLDDTTRRSITSGELTVEDILKAGLYALSKSVASQGAPSQPMLPSLRDASPGKPPLLRIDRIFVIENMMHEHAHSLPDPYVNCIRIKQLCAVAAARCNAEILGITFGQLCDEETESPLHDASVTEDAENAACAARFRHVSLDLRPTAAQIRCRHHPWIDTIPSPTLRQRLIQCISSDPPMVDEDDFCLDLQNDGLICWGSTLGRADRPSGSGAPWDVRSWEAQPWFLRKWWFVLGGSTGELYQTSKWWNEMRGDRLRYA